jgi:phosphoenolpyruvate carboxykinase (ATP)
MSAPPLFVMPKNVLFSLGLPLAENTFYQLSPDKLMQQCVKRKEGMLNSVVKQTGGISLNVFIVKDNTTVDTVDWNDNNQPIEERFFDGLYRKMIEHFNGKNIWIRDSYIGVDWADRLHIRSISEDPESDLFLYNMFLHPTPKEIENFNPDWYIIHTPAFSADPKTDGIEKSNFMIINFTKKIILIGGLAYDNEVKGRIFSILRLKAES